MQIRPTKIGQMLKFLTYLKSRTGNLSMCQISLVAIQYVGSISPSSEKCVKFDIFKKSYLKKFFTDFVENVLCFFVSISHGCSHIIKIK